MRTILFLNILFSMMSVSSFAAEDPRFNYRTADADFSNSPHATFSAINRTWLLTGYAKETESVFYEDGKFPFTYEGRRAFRQLFATFTRSHHGPPYQFSRNDSYRYVEEDKKTYIASGVAFTPADDWRIEYRYDGNTRINGDISGIFFVGECSYKLTARVTLAGNLLVKQELHGAKGADGCAELRSFAVYAKSPY